MADSIAVIADDQQFIEFSSQRLAGNFDIQRMDKFGADADPSSFKAIFDFQFEVSPAGLQQYLSFFPIPVFINAVNWTNKELKEVVAREKKNWNILRVNAWPGFLARPLMEVAGDYAAGLDFLEKTGLQWKLTPDKPGFISARVLAMIINEAYIALEENVSSREEIDTAMKLGTNYPYGPFEWCNRIGCNHILTLLQSMSRENPRYEPAGLLQKEINA
jgi:3-hydroxybutyryl-CoA dehydrogenase